MKMKKTNSLQKNQLNKVPIRTNLKNNWQLYLMLLPAIAYYFIFSYIPMYGVQIALKDYSC